MSKPGQPINVEDLILRCVPGGDTCDPQKVADAIREYAAAVPALVQPEPFIAALRAYADNEYCLGIRMASGHDECLGWEHKLKVGKFGRAEMEAHKKMNRHLGALFGIHEAIKRTLAASPSASQPEPSADLTIKCLPNGVLFDAFGRERVRYVRVTLDGAHLILHPNELEGWKADEPNPDQFTYTDVYLSPEEADALPEFDGF